MRRKYVATFSMGLRSTAGVVSTYRSFTELTENTRSVNWASCEGSNVVGTMM